METNRERERECMKPKETKIERVSERGRNRESEISQSERRVKVQREGG